MKYATLLHNGRTLVALIDEDGAAFWPVAEVFAALPPAAAGDMTSFIAEAAGLGAPRLAGSGTPLGEATLCAPIIRPRRDIICVGKNYHEHAREFTASGYDSSAASIAQALPKAPIIFGKSIDTVTSPGADILLYPGVDQFVDYEGELAVIIGRGGRNITREDALAHIFGYTIVNDVTARDLQERHKQWYLAKSIETGCPMGPWIAPAGAIDLDGGRLRCWVNDELRQDARFGDMIFDIPALIETISAGMRLEAGDVIATGTPAGVGLGFKPPKFLKAGDRVRIEVAGIGVLENAVRTAPPSARGQ